MDSGQANPGLLFFKTFSKEGRARQKYIHNIISSLNHNAKSRSAIKYH
jgi:hypothetical protein